MENYMRNQRKKSGRDDFKPSFNAATLDTVRSPVLSHLSLLGVAKTTGNATEGLKVENMSCASCSNPLRLVTARESTKGCARTGDWLGHKDTG